MRTRTIALLATVTLAAAACSSSGDDSASTDDTATVETNTEATDVVATDGAADSTPDGDPDSEFCQKILELNSGEADEPQNSDETLAILDELIDVAPDDLQDEMTTLRGAFEELGDYGADGPTDSASLERFDDVFSRDEVVQASDAIGNYNVDVCGSEPPPVASAETVTVPELSVPELSVPGE